MDIENLYYYNKILRKTCQLRSKNKAIQLFVKKYEDYLEKRILYEKKQADEDIELRKRQFDN